MGTVALGYEATVPADARTPRHANHIISNACVVVNVLSLSHIAMAISVSLSVFSSSMSMRLLPKCACAA